MTFTNHHHLPEPYVRAVTNDRYVGGGDISVTSLIKPPQMRALEIKHDAEITEDVADRVWALLGSSVHAVLERVGDADAFHEERLSMQIEGWTVSGQTDRYREDGSLIDFKVTSAWALKPGEPVKPEWAWQLNCYAQLWRANGFAVTGAQIMGILRDWSKREAQRNDGYAQRPVVLRDVELLPPGEVLAYMRKRVQLHQQALAGHYPLCTPVERWAKPDVYAVTKEGNKRAAKLCASLREAEAVAADLAERTRAWRRLELPVTTTRIAGCAPEVGGRQREPEGRPMLPSDSSRGRG